MTVRLSPELAVAYVRELSADVRGVAVLDPSGAGHAEPPALAAPAVALARALGHAWLRTPDGLALVARGPEGHALVVVAGPHALAGPTALDAAAAVAALTAAAPGAPPAAFSQMTAEASQAARDALAAVCPP